MSVDAIRKATISSSKRGKTEVVKVNGVGVEVRQMSLANRKLIMAKSTSADPRTGRVSMDMTDWQIWSVIETCFDPETGEKIYNDADYNELLSHLAGGWLTELIEASDRLNTVSTEQAEKNLEEIQSDSSSSGSPKSSEAGQ